MGLSEPKIKQRISADPRNLAWSNDRTKFGYKMLSKMGWEPGKGLGLNEDGIQENIHLHVKQDYLGVGASKRTIDNWLDNSFAFDELLKGLNKGNNDVDKHDPNDDQKLGKKVENSKSGTDSIEFNVSNGTSSTRLAHRAKFLKSKKASVKDAARLNEILGIKTKSDSPSTISLTGETAGRNDFSDSFSGVQTIVNKLSAKDYFASKTKTIVKSKITTSECELEERPALGIDGFGSSHNEEMTAFSGLGFVPNSTRRKEKKKRKLIVDSDCAEGSEKKKKIDREGRKKKSKSKSREGKGKIKKNE